MRVGVIGHTGKGNYGHGLDVCWLEIPGCEIVGIADPDEKGRAAAAKKLKISHTFADYRQLMDQTKPDAKGDIKSNFEKFLIGKDGKLLRRFKTGVKPDSPEVVSAVEEALK